jgi:MSHA biogenesis protein MshQ
VRIIHDGSGLTCSPEPVTLKACANADCSTLFTSNVVVTLGTSAGTWASNPVTIVNGTATVNISNPSASTSTLSGTVNSPSATNTAATCYKGSTANDCGLIFTDASCSLDAVEPTKSPNTAILTKRFGNSVTLDVLALNNGVINSGSTATIAATLVSAGSTGCSTTALSPTVNFTLTGANAGRKSVTFSPTAAARNVRVRMVSGTLVGCSSDNFAIRPSSFALTASGAGADATGVSATNAPVLKAASAPFSLSAATSAAGYDGAPTINQNMVLSSGTHAGNLAGTFSAASATSGTAQGSAFTYSEAGYFKLDQFGVYDDAFADVDEAKLPADCFSDANLGSASAPADPNFAAPDGRIGCYFGNTPSAYFGRFIPDHFVLSGGAIVNRSAIAACAASTYSYLGEALTPTFTLTAANSLGETTANYSGTFARLDVASQLGMGAIDTAASGRTPFPVCGATPAHPCFTPGTASGTFVDGEAPDMAAPLTVFRPTTPVGPFATFSVGFAPVDPDGVKIATYDLDTVNVFPTAAFNHALAGSTIVRYGRMNIDNAYGSELLNLTMKVKAQYWTGSATGYATNMLDSCTVPAFTPFAAIDYLPTTGAINATTMPFSKLVPGPALVNGASQLVLTKPGLPVPTSRGSVTVRSSLGYLPGNGRATFGVYKAGPVIYVREIY